MSQQVVISLAPTYRLEIALAGQNGSLELLDAPQSLDILLSPIFRGPKGDKGDDGDPGPIGPPGGTTYQHDQMLAATVWTINHNLSRYPSVTVVDSAGSLVEGDLDYVNANTLIVSFSTAFAGIAYLN